MSASNPFPHPARAALLAIVLTTTAACLHDALAQVNNSAVTAADIERAERSQPVITDDDIRRAQNKYRMPTDDMLRRVPIPSAPNLDALPAPGSPRTIDLEALAKGYEANDRMAAVQGIRPGPGLLVFVSFAMPEPTLQRLVDQAARAQAALVIRGFVNGSLRDTVARAQRLIGHRQVAFHIDPQAFDRFAVVKTPTFVLVRDGAQGHACGAGLCFAPDAFAATAGDVSLDYALDIIERQVPRFGEDARRYLKKIRG